jgi:hypothetical protein
MQVQVRECTLLGEILAIGLASVISRISCEEIESMGRVQAWTPYGFEVALSNYMK